MQTWNLFACAINTQYSWEIQFNPITDVFSDVNDDLSCESIYAWQMISKSRINEWEISNKDNKRFTEDL